MEKNVACTGPSYKAFLIFKFAGGLLLIIAGFIKFFGINLLPHWHYYITNYYANFFSYLPLTINGAIYVIGLFEVTIGVLIITYWTKIGALIASVWLFTISLNLLMMGLFDLALRDLVIASSYCALAYLAHGRE